MTEESSKSDLIELATELTTAWLANPNTRVSVDDVPAFLNKMHETVANLAAPGAGQEEVPPAVEYTPAVTVRRSLASKDHIISLIDGKAYKTLKRHLSGHGLTPAQYRERYSLKSDYPMVAESYAEMRRNLAKKIGLGRKAGATVAAKATAKPAAKASVTPAEKSAPAAKPKAPAKPKAAPKPKTAAKPKAAPAIQSSPVEAAAES